MQLVLPLTIASILPQIENFLWGYICFPFVILFGLFFTLKSRALQIRYLPKIMHLFFSLFKSNPNSLPGIHPLKVFFTSIGGCIGIGNIVGICIAIQLGGPGALFWIWVGGILGMIMKYNEVFLGIKYRVKNQKHSYDGGPMFFLQKAFSTKTFAYLSAILLCFYGIEIFMFRVMIDSLSSNWNISRNSIAIILLLAILYAASGGIQRVGKICSAIIPVFILIYSFMSLWVIVSNFSILPELFKQIFSHAFTGHAAIGGFAGSTFLLMAKEGIERGCYSSDIGIGYASIIHSETSFKNPKKQAALAIFGVFIDNFIICTLSILLILCTDVWQQNISPDHLIQSALATQFPYMYIFMPIFILILGYSTVIAFYCVGLKCAKFLYPKLGTWFFNFFAILMFLLFASPKTNTLQAFAIMQISGGILLILNFIGMLRLRKDFDYNLNSID